MLAKLAVKTSLNVLPRNEGVYEKKPLFILITNISDVERSLYISQNVGIPGIVFRNYKYSEERSVLRCSIFYFPSVILIKCLNEII